MKLCKAAAGMILGLSVCALVPRSVQAEDNPFLASVEVRYTYGGPEYLCWSPWQQVGQDPVLANYDGCQTAVGRGFVHAHFSHGFSFWQYNSDLEEWVEVTAERSDEYWDQAYGVDVGAWEKVSGSTLARSGHGYSTGRNYWVVGIDIIIADEWNYIDDNMPKGSCIHATWQHSWRVPEIYEVAPPVPPGWFARSEKVRCEKAGSGGVYTFSHRLEGEMAEPPYWEQQ